MALDVQFDRAEYVDAAQPQRRCSACERGLAGEFYRFDGRQICAVCAERIRGLLPRDDRRTYWRAAAIGTVAAIGAGLALLLLLRLLHAAGGGYGLGFGAIGVGYAVGYAMRAATKGLGGRKYQWMAAMLTYAAIAFVLGADLLGLGSVPVWAYPFFVLTPLVNLAAAHYKLALLELFIAFIGIRWAWMLAGQKVPAVEGPFPTPRSGH